MWHTHRIQWLGDDGDDDADAGNSSSDARALVGASLMKGRGLANETGVSWTDCVGDTHRGGHRERWTKKGLSCPNLLNSSFGAKPKKV